MVLVFNLLFSFQFFSLFVLGVMPHNIYFSSSQFIYKFKEKNRDFFFSGDLTNFFEELAKISLLPK
jgi:hypothetical protein